MLSLHYACAIWLNTFFFLYGLASIAADTSIPFIWLCYCHFIYILYHRTNFFNECKLLIPAFYIDALGQEAKEA